MQRNQSTPVKIVSRSRFRSTTEDEPSEEETPPPNRSDRPPPLPLCSSTSRTISRLVMIRTTAIAMTTADLVLPVPCSGAHGQLTVPADSRELTGVEAGATNQGTIDGWLGHHHCDVVGLNRPAIQDTHIRGRIGAVNRGNPVTDGRSGLLRVLWAGHFAGADRPDWLVSDHQSRHPLGAAPRPPAIPVRRCVPPTVPRAT